MLQKGEPMKDLISRQAAIDALNEYFARIGKLKRRGLTKGEKAISLDTVGTIKTLPSAEPKRGKWIKTARWGRVYYCNQCRNYLDFDGVNAGRGSTNFCPNCGADMRGEQDE